MPLAQSKSNFGAYLMRMNYWDSMPDVFDADELRGIVDQVIAIREGWAEPVKPIREDGQYAITMEWNRK